MWNEDVDFTTDPSDYIHHDHSNNNNYKSQDRNCSSLHPPQISIFDSIDSLNQSNYPSLLAPPSLYSRERRLSSSSCDSSFSHCSRRRHRRNSTNRLSDFNNEGDDVTLLSFSRKVCDLFSRTCSVFRRFGNRLLVRSKPQKPKLVCEAEIMDQVNFICKDYIITKLTNRELMSRKVGLTLSYWPRSVHVISACSMLETIYPRTYSNVSRKLGLTMSSPKVVRQTLTSFLEVLFEGETTWAKMVSMFTVAGLFAEECSSQGHADFAKVVLETVVNFTSHHLLPWLVAQGGWDSFPVPNEDGSGYISKRRVLALLGGTTATIYSLYYYYLNFW